MQTGRVVGGTSPPLGPPPLPPAEPTCCCLLRWPRPPRPGGTWRRRGLPAGVASGSGPQPHYPARRRALPPRSPGGRRGGRRGGIAPPRHGSSRGTAAALAARRPPAPPQRSGGRAEPRWEGRRGGGRGQRWRGAGGGAAGHLEEGMRGAPHGRPEPLGSGAARESPAARLAEGPRSRLGTATCGSSGCVLPVPGDNLAGGCHAASWHCWRRLTDPGSGLGDSSILRGCTQRRKGPDPDTAGTDLPPCQPWEIRV